MQMRGTVAITNAAPSFRNDPRELDLPIFPGRAGRGRNPALCGAPDYVELAACCRADLDGAGEIGAA